MHHAVRARYAIERGRLWQAEYWTSAVRDHALMLACKRLGLEAGLGRGFDALPSSYVTRPRRRWCDRSTMPSYCGRSASPLSS